MSKVYVVTEWAQLGYYYFDFKILGVYTNKDAAEAAVKVADENELINTEHDVYELDAQDVCTLTRESYRQIALGSN